MGMRIGICDDDPKFCTVIAKILEEFLEPDDQVMIYHSGFQLLDSVFGEKLPIDLVLLDIEMPGISGLQTAAELRERQPAVIVIIITNYVKYALNGYEIKAFHYLLKPLNTTKLKNEIEKARFIVGNFVKDQLHVHTKEASYFLQLNNILYIESLGRILTVHTPSADYKYYKRISQLYYELKDKGFFRIHKSFIVNLIFVSHVDRTSRQAILLGGAKLPIAPTKVNDLISMLLSIGKMRL